MINNSNLEIKKVLKTERDIDDEIYVYMYRESDHKRCIVKSDEFGKTVIIYDDNGNFKAQVKNNRCGSKFYHFRDGDMFDIFTALNAMKKACDGIWSEHEKYYELGENEL